MSKKVLISGIGLVLLIMIGMYFINKGQRPKLKSGSSYYFEIDQGSEIEFRLHANGSTGYENCWLNQSSCKNLRLKKKVYSSSWAEMTGSNGAGGSELWTLETLRTGRDTLIIASCPTKVDQKDCSDYSEGLGKIEVIVNVFNP